RNPPIVDIAVQQLQFFRSAGQNKVVGSALIVIKEIILDSVGAMSQAQNEVLVAEVGVVLHHVPQNGPVSDIHHGLGRIFSVAYPQTLPSAKKNHLHEDSPASLAFTGRRPLT